MVPLMFVFPIVFVAVFGSMVVEALRAERNERVQRQRGGIEPAGDVYALMRVAYPGLFLAMMLEGAIRGLPPRPLVFTGVAVFLAAKILKWWAIQALGSAWTFRVIVVPGASLVREGPYRYLSHPNYLAVTGELAGVALISGAWLTGPVALLVFGALMLRRMAVENGALRSGSGL